MCRSISGICSPSWFPTTPLFPNEIHQKAKQISDRQHEYKPRQWRTGRTATANRFSKCGKENRTAIPMRKRADERKVVPTWEGDFENQNTTAIPKNRYRTFNCSYLFFSEDIYIDMQTKSQIILGPTQDQDIPHTCHLSWHPKHLHQSIHYFYGENRHLHRLNNLHSFE